MSRLIPNIDSSNITFNENSPGINLNNNNINNVNNITFESSKIKIGNNAGEFNQGSNTIAIGEKAGQTGQANNTIVLNANGTGLNGSDNTGAFYIKPIRSATGSNQLFYNETSGEITYSTSSSSSFVQAGKELVEQDALIQTTSIAFPEPFTSMPTTVISIDNINNTELVNKFYTSNITETGFNAIVDAGQIAPNIVTIYDQSSSLTQLGQVIQRSNGKPSIAHLETNMIGPSLVSNVRYLISKDSKGETAGAWNNSILIYSKTSNANPVPVNSRNRISFEIINNKPAIAFSLVGDSVFGEIFYMIAKDSNGATAGAWNSPVLIDTYNEPSSNNYNISLKTIAGKPAICYYFYDFNGMAFEGSVKYVIAKDSNGATAGAWNTPVTAIPAPVSTFVVPILYNSNDKPSIIYGSTDLLFIRSNNETGGSWNSPTVINDMPILAGAGDIDVININNKPAVVHNYNGILRYYYSNNSTGSSWNPGIIIPSGITGGNTLKTSVRLQIIDGNPAIVSSFQYSDTNLFDLNYSTSNNSTGSDWNTTISIETFERPSNIQMFSSFIPGTGDGGNNIPLISYIGETLSLETIDYIRYDPPTVDYNINWIATT